MTLEEKKDLQDIIINNLVGVSGLLDMLPEVFERNGYDINVKIVPCCDDTVYEMIKSSEKNIALIGDYLRKLKTIESCLD